MEISEAADQCRNWIAAYEGWAKAVEDEVMREQYKRNAEVLRTMCGAVEQLQKQNEALRKENDHLYLCALRERRDG